MCFHVSFHLYLRSSAHYSYDNSRLKVQMGVPKHAGRTVSRNDSKLEVDEAASLPGITKLLITCHLLLSGGLHAGF